MSTKEMSAIHPKDIVILCAEDDPNDVFILKRAMSKLGCKLDVRFVDDGAEAIDWLSGEGDYADRKRFPLPDMLVTDLKMPRRSGMDVLVWLRGQKQFKDLHVIVHSTSELPSEISACLRLGANKFITKTHTAKRLIHYLGGLLKCKNFDLDCYADCPCAQLPEPSHRRF